MNAMTEQQCSETSRKRSRPDYEEQHPSLDMAKSDVVMSVESAPTPPYTTSPPSDQSRPDQRQASEAPSSSALSSVGTSTIVVRCDPLPDSTSVASQPPTKKRKLTFAEKEEQRMLKEVQLREKEIKRAEREQDRLAKDEEKRLKAEERRAKAEEREMKKREVELVRQQKAEVEEKKAKSQLRLTSLFAKPQSQPQTPAKVTTTMDDKSAVPLESYDAIVAHQHDSTPLQKVISPEQRDSPKVSEYRRFFLPFCQPSHSTLAAEPYMNISEEHTALKLAAFEASGSPTAQMRPPALSDLLGATRPISRGRRGPRVSAIITAIQSGLPRLPSLDADEHHSRSPQDLLDQVVLRHLHFAEDVRPPYFGSYTKITNARDASKLGRSPFSRIRTDTNYDYDSEAEWDEPEEGEDILSDGEDDAESVESGEEMEGFLDDEDDPDRPRPKQPISELVPVCTPILWEDTSEPSAIPAGLPFDIDSMRLEWLLEVPEGSIDPFSTTYWQKEATEKTDSTEVRSSPWTKTATALAKPDESKIIGAGKGLKGPLMALKAQKPIKAPAPKLIGEPLAEFRDAVEGSNLSKVDLLKALKLRFPETTNETLKETLGCHCARMGASAEEKRWRFLEA